MGWSCFTSTTTPLQPSTPYHHHHHHHRLHNNGEGVGQHMGRDCDCISMLISLAALVRHAPALHPFSTTFSIFHTAFFTFCLFAKSEITFGRNRKSGGCWEGREERAATGDWGRRGGGGGGRGRGGRRRLHRHHGGAGTGLKAWLQGGQL